MRGALLLVALSIGALSTGGLTGCATVGAEPSAAELRGTLSVFAAASLSEAFDSLAAEFETEHPALEVTVNYGGSTALAQQIVQGAPADVFAAASDDAMDVVLEANLTAHPEVFATNILELAVPAGNPADVAGLEDLAKPELIVALCAPEVPCGDIAQRMLEAAGVTASVDTFEQDVRAVLTKIELGEVDAGLVYRTDVLAAAESVEGIALPGAGDFETPYPIATLTSGTNRTAAQAFMRWVLGDHGKAVLGDAGFGSP